ncbi:hypothetical protein PCANC_01730 [Puccinia coronata f. sp. avenae]|uniref:Uncharacterized protein n=1 Tax=Puccinia coronata f. sp. avenae TaxID=200324 RepID=A0A2N5VQU4_9BASI|nr:hypothetical protein PCANC_15704 [Puccinia coronata f. sp. avenae]PLW52346.1 hypothetical protein PCASD_00178 [Puccinia coronata f. sp. avenae]PLW56759.1 hypothetical protein PCANC_01730 [Puccinia coronata f. sp. avenae]
MHIYKSSVLSVLFLLASALQVLSQTIQRRPDECHWPKDINHHGAHYCATNAFHSGGQDIVGVISPWDQKSTTNLAMCGGVGATPGSYYVTACCDSKMFKYLDHPPTFHQPSIGLGAWITKSSFDQACK